MMNMISRRHMLVVLGSTAVAAKVPGKKEPEVTATEDLMREHGVLRRILLVYGEMVPRLRSGKPVEAAPVGRAAELFKRFGEEYHENLLEEKHIFPVVRKMQGEAAKYPDILQAQHARGREITAFVRKVTSSGRVYEVNREPLAAALQTLVRMYEHHAAREDTIVFPAWKENYTDKQLDEIGDQFEDIEKKMFGHDGFEDAVKTIGEIEAALGMADLAQFTAPAVPS